MFRKMTFAFITVFAIVTFILFGFSDTVAAESDVGLDVAIVGLPEFTPGTTSSIEISVQNNNLVDKIDSPALHANVAQYYGAAVSLTARLEKGYAPIVVRTEEALLGTLSVGGATPPVPFIIEVDEDANPGVYQVTVLLTYRTLVLATEKEEGDYGADLDWSNRTETKKLEIAIKEESLEFEITGVEADLQPGARTQIRVMFKNDGDETARHSEAKLSANTPISLTDNSAFLGTLEPGATAVGIFRLKVDGDAIPKEYVLDAIIKYDDDSGNEHVSEKFKVPIKVAPASPLAEAVGRHFVGMILGAGFMGAIWFVWHLFAESRRKKAG